MKRPHFLPLSRRDALSLGVAGALTAVQIARAAPFVAARDPQCVDVSPDGQWAATVCSGMSNSEDPPRPHPDVRKCAVITGWTFADGQQAWRDESFGDFVDVRFSPDSKLVATARLFAQPDGLAMHEVVVRRADTGEIVRGFERCHAFSFGPDSKSIAVQGRKNCAVFDATTGERLRILDGLTGALSLAWSPAGDRVAGVVRENDQWAPKIVSADKGETIAAALPFVEPFYSLAWSPDGKRLASGHPTGDVLLWDDRLGLEQQLQTGVRGLCRPFFSPDGSLVAAGDQTTGHVAFWRTRDGLEVARHGFDKCGFHTYLARGEQEVERPEKDPHRFAFGPDGESFVAGCYGGIVRRVEDGQELRRLGQ